MPNASLRILVPEATTNYITNPSFRYDTTGWNSSGSTISRFLTRAYIGIASLFVLTNGSVLNEGAYFRVSSLVGTSDFVTVSAYVRGNGKVRIRLIDNPRGMQYSSIPVVLNDLRWQRIEVTGRITGSNDVRLYVETADTAPKSTIFYIDGAQMELKAYSTSYCDGDQPDCAWDVVDSSTISTRRAESRRGGRFVSLAGPCRGDDDVYVTTVGGLGMPPISNNIQNFAVSPGSYHQNVKINNRVITFLFNAKNKSLDISRNPSLEKLHFLRQQLIDIIKPDNGNDESPFIFEYADGAVPIYFEARYETGLDGGWDIRNQWSNSFPLRLLAVNPVLWEDSLEVNFVRFSNSLGTSRAILAREDGAWNSMNGGTDGAIYSIALGAKGEVYVAGNFSIINRNGAISPNLSARSVAVWDGTKFSPIGNGNLTGGTLDIMVVITAPNGNLYAGGNFTAIGGVAANNIAFWNGTTWTALGTGTNGTVNTIAIAPNGDVYVGGSFTTAGGKTVNRIARYRFGTWSAMGAYTGLNNLVSSIVITNDGGTLYVGGSFSDENTNPGLGYASYATRYTASTNLFSALGRATSFNNTVSSLFLDNVGTLYAAGNFTTGNSGATTLNYIAQWNGAMWTPVGNGVNLPTSSIRKDREGRLLVVGSMTLAGNVVLNNLAIWNGTTWTQSDLEMPTGAYYTEVLCHPNGNLYIGGSGTGGGQPMAAYLQNIENVGSLSVKPKIYIIGPARLRWIENQTTQKKIYINLEIFSGEEITIDFSVATMYSNTRGIITYAVLPGSDMADFRLAPGMNIISMFMANDVNARAYLMYRPAHWSVDATARGDGL